jgi:hypothetical protein
MIREAAMKLREALFGRAPDRSDELEAELARCEHAAVQRRAAVSEARMAMLRHACDRPPAGHPRPNGYHGAD